MCEIMKKNGKDDPQDIAEEIHNSDAAQTYALLETLRTNFYFFDRNYSELIKLLGIADNTKGMLEIWDYKNKDKFELLEMELMRLVLNFLASASALVDHTRVVIRKIYAETEFSKEYQAQIDARFTDNPTSGFVEELRHFNLHYTYPNIITSLSGNADNKSIDFSFSFYKPQFENWSGKTSKSKSFLETAEEKIDIRNLVIAYYQQVKEFHEWLYKRLQTLHSEELKWFQEMQNKMINAMDDEEREMRGFKKRE